MILFFQNAKMPRKASELINMKIVKVSKPVYTLMKADSLKLEGERYLKEQTIPFCHVFSSVRSINTRIHSFIFAIGYLDLLILVYPRFM